jgi:hypothetical protein
VRVLLDEHLLVDLGRDLHGHQVDTVVGRGWAGVKNGDLLQRMRGEYEVLLTMDRGLEFQQNISALPFGVLLIRADSNRMAVPAILEALSAIKAGRVCRVGIVRGIRRGRRGAHAVRRRLQPFFGAGSRTNPGLGALLLVSAWLTLISMPDFTGGAGRGHTWREGHLEPGGTNEREGHAVAGRG